MPYYLKSESSGGNVVELSVLPITVGSNIGDYVEWSGFASGGSTYTLVGISTSFDSLVNVRGGDIRFRPDDRSNNDFSSNYTQPAYNQDFVVRIERVAANTWECFLNGQSLGTKTDSRDFNFDQLLKFTGSGTPLEGGMYYFEISTSGGAATNRWDADASGGTGSKLLDTIGGQDADLELFPTDGSQWVYYEDVGEPSGTEQPVTLTNAVQGEHASALSIVQSQKVVGQQAVQAESATSLLIAAIQQIAQQNARQNESAQSSAVTQQQPVASNPAVQSETAVQMQIEQSGAQSVVLNNAVQNETASALTLEQQQNVIATVAQQLEYAELSNVTQVQAVTLATATQAESAAPLNIEQYSGQLVTLVAAQQAESAPALFISTISAVAVNPALQQESAASTNIQQSQQLIQVSAVQLEYAEILRIITSGDQTDLSGLRLVPVTDIYSLNPINPVTYTLREL